MIRHSYCDHCGKKVEFQTFEKEKTATKKGVAFTYVETYCVCAQCGAYVDDPDIGETNLQRYYDAYKSAVGLLTRKEIIAIREKYGLSADIFGLILGLGAKTITRYENGAIQTRSADNLIRLADDIANMEKMASAMAKRIASPVEEDRKNLSRLRSAMEKIQTQSQISKRG